MAGGLMQVSNMQRVSSRVSGRKVLPCKAMESQRPGGRGRVASLAEPIAAELPTVQMLDRPGGRGRVAELQPAAPQAGTMSVDRPGGRGRVAELQPAASPAGTVSVDRPGGRGRLFVPDPINQIQTPIVVDRPGGRSNRLAFDSSDGNGNGKDGGSGGSGDSGDWSRWPLFAGAYATICAGAWAIQNHVAAAPAAYPTKVVA